jgi:hypothetical protein
MQESRKKRKFKIPTSMRLSQEGMLLAQELAKKFGVTKSAVMEMALRALAEKEGLR